MAKSLYKSAFGAGITSGKYKASMYDVSSLEQQRSLEGKQLEIESEKLNRQLTNITSALSKDGAIRMRAWDGASFGPWHTVAFNIDVVPTLTVTPGANNFIETVLGSVNLTATDPNSENLTVTRVGIAPVVGDFLATSSLVDNGGGSWTFKWTPSVGTTGASPQASASAQTSDL